MVVKISHITAVAMALLMLIIPMLVLMPSPTAEPSGRADVIFVDSFEEGALGWSTGGDLNEWEVGNPNGGGEDPGPTSVPDGDSLFGTDLDDTYDETCDQWLMTPGISLFNLSGATLTFQLWYDLTLQATGQPPYEDPVDELFLEIATDPGGTFTLIENYNHTSGTESQWDEHTVSLDAWIGSNVWLRWRLVDVPQGYQDNGAYIDMVEIKGDREIQIDAEVESVVGPDRIDLNTMASFDINVKNSGKRELINTTVKFEITDSLDSRIYYDYTIVPSIDVGAEQTYTYNWTPTVTGDYVVYGEVVVSNDEDLSNDQVKMYIEVVNIIYTTGFDSSKERLDWLGNETRGMGTRWQETSSQSYSGSSSFWCGEQLSGMYVSDTDDRLESPLFDLSVMDGASLEFWHNFSFQNTIEAYDGGIIEARTPDGNWTKLFPDAGYNTYIVNGSTCSLADQNAFGKSIDEWTKVTVSLDDFAGGYVQVGFMFCSDDATVDTGWFIDDVTIMGTPETTCEPAEGAPPEITGLSIEDKGNGYIKVNWDESDLLDFDHYNIYISDVDFNCITGMNSLHQIYRRDQHYATLSGLDQTKTYYIGVTITDTDGYENTTVTTVSGIPKETVAVNQEPMAVISGSLTGAQAGETVYFHGQNSNDPDGFVVQWRWNFGDGESSDAESPTHVYSRADTYTVTLTVTDDDGSTNTTTRQITIEEEQDEGESIDMGQLQLVAIFLIIIAFVVVVIVLVFYRRRQIDKSTETVKPLEEPADDDEMDDDYVVFSKSDVSPPKRTRARPATSDTDGGVTFSKVAKGKRMGRRGRTSSMKKLPPAKSIEPEVVYEQEKKDKPRDAVYKETVTKPELLERINISITKVKCPSCDKMIRVKVPKNMKGSDSIAVECPHCGAEGEIGW